MQETVTPNAAPRRPTPERPVFGLVLIGSLDEPERVGEVALIPGTTAMLGRASSVPGERVPHLELVRQRPGRNEPTGALRTPTLSREQLRLEADWDRLSVTSVGRAAMRVGGRTLDAVEATAGTVIELDDVAAFLVVRRPPLLVGDPPVFPFAAPDVWGLVGESPQMWALRRHIAFVGARREHVLVRGPSGSGKERVASALHRQSSRAARQLVARNAATLPEGLVDAELFGNARGYPNAGMPERPGLVGEADGGTLFLDEIAEMPEGIQAHLLRLLDAGEYHRLGEARARRADLRLIGATNRPLDALKHDVLARLALRVEVPGLDERADDVPLIARHLLRQLRDVDPGAMSHLGLRPGELPNLHPALAAQLVQRRWTGHVRELMSILWSAVARAEDGVLLEAELDTPAPDAEADLAPERVQAVLDKHGGAQEPAWKELGLSSRHALFRLVKKYGLRVRGRG